MNYPFEFNEMRITDTALTKLGFSEYRDGAGDYGTRRFMGEYVIVEEDEKDDANDGYGQFEVYMPQMFHSDFKVVPYRAIHFLHDLYEDIRKNNPELLDAFVEKTKERGVNMWHYLESYLKYLEKQK